MLLYQFQTMFIGILSFDLQKHPLRNIPEMSLTCLPHSTTTIWHKPIKKKMPLWELWDPAPYAKGLGRGITYPCITYIPRQQA